MAQEHSVFISYSSRDSEFVKRIIKQLDQIGVSYWKAPEMIPAGSSYAREIPKAIQQCSLFLLVLSPTSQDSIWVEKEIDNAICNRKTIIPFEIREVVLNDTFRFYLNNVQMISFAHDPEGAFDDLRRQIYQIFPELKRSGVAANGQVHSSGMVTRRQSVAAGDKVNVAAGTSQIALEQGDPKKRVLSITTASGRNSNRGNSNALRMNRIPLACQYCGCKDLENITIGTYRCVRCGRENYDDFQTIRNYLEKAGATSASVIERDTGVPRRIIEYFFRDEYLEIPKNSSVRVPCAVCGAPIRTGTLCENCKADPVKRQQADRKGKWHTLW